VNARVPQRKIRSALASMLIPALTLALALTAYLTFTAPASSSGNTRAVAKPADVLHGVGTTRHAAPTPPKATARATHMTVRHFLASAARHSGHHGRPAPRTELITLVPGDTLSGLALRYGTTVPVLQELNGLGNSTLIYASATFRVPVSAPNHARCRHGRRLRPPQPVASLPASHVAPPSDTTREEYRDSPNAPAR
jgi:hypothetical protein